MTDFKRRDTTPAVYGSRLRWLRVLGPLVAVVVITLGTLAWLWSREPAIETMTTRAGVTGLATLDAAIHVAQTLLEKPGGYLSNDVMPPGTLLDNLPNWEFGALVQLRDLMRVLRNDFSRSGTQSIEDPDLAMAEPLFNADSGSWLFPAAESEYREGIEYLDRYRSRLIDANPADGNFFARAEDLREWLAVVEKRLGNLSQRLSASIGQRRIDVSLAKDAGARAAKDEPGEVNAQTAWLEIDDVFYEARGAAWALAQFLRAAEKDFAGVLEDKNANRTLAQVIGELEDALVPMRSPVVLNGQRYGIFANHSLVMAGYLSRANAAVVNLRELLSRG